MHEPIISKELFDKAQKNKRKTKILYKNTLEGERYKNIFSRMIRCPDGRNMFCKKDI